MNDNIVFDELNTKIQNIGNKFLNMNINLNIINDRMEFCANKIDNKWTMADSIFPAFCLENEEAILSTATSKELGTFYTSYTSTKTAFDKGTFSFRIYYLNRGTNTRLNKDYLSITVQKGSNTTIVNTNTFSDFYYFNYDHVECYQTESMQLPLNSKCTLTYIINSPNSTASIIKNGVWLCYEPAIYIAN